MLSHEQVDFTVNTLVNTVRNNRQRLRIALRKREDAHKEAEGGHENYRIAWLRESVGTMLEVLEEIARDFNAGHPDELCSAEDFKDILVSALRTLAQHDK